MDKLTMETFLKGRPKLWFGITWGLFLLGVLVLPDVDRLTAKYRELKKLRGQSALRVGLLDHNRTLANHIALKQEDLATLEVVLVPTAALSKFKQDIATMARNTLCQLRAIRPGSISRRSFDEFLGRGSNDPKRQTKTPEWKVEEQSLDVSIQGSYENLVDFVSALDNDVRVLQLASMYFHPLPDTSEQLILELRIIIFDLLYDLPK
ncbi:MAG: hypothetical protein JSV03_08590 [Planctomycetota bacterium]|nr:MAG: hypothetical protein JSV03_08590 [Planctomycetota bacterium]